MGRLGTEIEISAAPGLHDRILVEAIGPLLHGGRADRSRPRYLFLREPGDKDGRLRIWFDAPPAEIGPLLRSAQEAVRTTCRIGPAEALETTGPFTGRAAAPFFT